jgi:hypothetical protein
MRIQPNVERSGVFFNFCDVAGCFVRWGTRLHEAADAPPS